MKLPISVFIIAKNEADRIPKPLLSVIQWADEVIVIDSGSDDGTLGVAETLGAKTVFNAWKGYGPQKVFGETLCRNKWLLNIDADEEITKELSDEIAAIFAKGEPACQAYKMKIRILSRFARYPAMFAPTHNRVRLYHSDYAGFKDSTVHDSVVLKENKGGKIGQLQNIVLHRSFRSYTHAIEKINRYSSMQAHDMLKHGRKPSVLRIITEPFLGFAKGYFAKRYCFMGLDGFIEGVIYAFARTIRLAKARELWKERDSRN
jgi:glycosyltransferase involved in cell wall biosynthesis